MPLQTYEPDLLERAIDILRLQLTKTIYPECDLLYASKESKKATKNKNKKEETAAASKRNNWKGPNYRKTIRLYNSTIDIFEQLTMILNKPIVFGHETFIIKLTNIAISTFFVENTVELQYASLKVCTQLYTGLGRDAKQSMIEDIFLILNKLPQSKKTKRRFKLRVYGKTGNGSADHDDQNIRGGQQPGHDDNNDEFSDQNSQNYIQMFTALLLYLIQSQVHRCKISQKDSINNDDDVVNTYKSSKKLARTLLVKLLRKRKEKTKEKNEKFDFRILFDDIVTDLITCVNRPEWPAAEMMVEILGRLLSEYFTTKAIDSNLRVGALDSLGAVAKKLRNDQIQAAENLTSGHLDTLINGIIGNLKSLLNNQRMEIYEIGQQWKDIMAAKEIDSQDFQKQMNQWQESSMGQNSQYSNNRLTNFRNQYLQDLICHLQTILIQHLAYHSASDSSLSYSINFNLGRWLDSVNILEEKVLEVADDNVLDSDDEDGMIDHDHDSQSQAEILENESINKMNKIEKRNFHKKIAEMKIKIRQNSLGTQSDFNQKNAENLNERKKVFVIDLDYSEIECINKFLASTRHLAHSFDTYMNQILRILGEREVSVRSRALKSLSEVVDVDPKVLLRPQVWSAVQARLNDQATLVREAAIDLLGRYIFSTNCIKDEYYEQIANRIGDTGVSVRKRVIKILRDLILGTRNSHSSEYLMEDSVNNLMNFTHSANACMRIITCINDEEGVKKLVLDTIYQIWFSPIALNSNQFTQATQEQIHQYSEKILNMRAEEISEAVMLLLKDSHNGFFEAVLDNLMSDKILKSEEISKAQEIKNKKDEIKTISQRICNILADKLTEISDSGHKLQIDNNKSVAIFYTLSIFCRYDATFLKDNVYNIPPFLSMDVKNPSITDTYVLISAASILEKTIPCLQRPGQKFGTNIQDCCSQILMNSSKSAIIRSTVNLLLVVTTSLTKRFDRVWILFFKIFRLLDSYSKKPDLQEKELIVSRRMILVMSHLARAFDLNNSDYKPKKFNDINIFQKILSLILIFIKKMEAKNSRLLTDLVAALGQSLLRYPEKMRNNSEIENLYVKYLTNDSNKDALQESLKIQVLLNLKDFLEDDDNKMTQKKMEMRRKARDANLKTLKAQGVSGGLNEQSTDVLDSLQSDLILQSRENVSFDANGNIISNNDNKSEENWDIRQLNDLSASQGAAIVQTYLKHISGCLMASSINIRKAALDVIYLTAHGGLVHPKFFIPLLIAASCDVDEKISQKAISQISKLPLKLVQSSAIQGTINAFILCNNICESSGSNGQNIVRGFRNKQLSNNLESITAATTDDDSFPVCGFIYLQLRDNKKQRRALLNSYLSCFDHDHGNLDYFYDKNKIIEQTLFFTDTLALLPYGTQDEPLWLLQVVDTNLSVIGNSVLTYFKDKCIDRNKKERDEVNNQLGENFDEPELQDQDSYEKLAELLVADGEIIKTFHQRLMACFLLYSLKSYLREAYNLTDRKVQEYNRLSENFTAQLSLSPNETTKITPPCGTSSIKNDTENNPEGTPSKAKKSDKTKKETKVEAKKKAAETKAYTKVFDRPVNRKIGIYFKDQPALKIVLHFLNNKKMINYSSDNCKITIIHQYTMFRQLLELIESIVDDEEDDEDFQAQPTENVKNESMVDTQRQERNIFGSVAECQVKTTIKQENSTPARIISSTTTARRLLINNKNSPATPTSRRLLISSTVAERAKNRVRKSKEYEMSDTEEESSEESSEGDEEEEEEDESIESEDSEISD